MATTAETYGFGARAPYAEPRASEYDMKERVRLSGLFPRVRNEPMSNQLQKLLKEFEQNAALTGILERRRRQEERMQYELQGREGMRALEMNRTPALRAGMAPIATSARVAATIAELPAVPPPEDAAAVMTGRRRRPAKRPEVAPAVGADDEETIDYLQEADAPRERSSNNQRNVQNLIKAEVVRRFKKKVIGTGARGSNE